MSHNILSASKTFSPQTPLADDVLCFTTSTIGGVSEGCYESLNVGLHVQDDSQSVRQNRQRLNDYLVEQSVKGGKRPADIPWLNQQHSNRVVTVNDLNSSPAMIADGCTANDRLQPLAVMTADCLPIVMASTQTNTITVVHAGWRGLLSNIIYNGVACFSPKESINAWIGPSISAQHFEIGQEVLANFKDYSHSIKEAENNKYFVDLRAIAVQQLTDLNVNNVEVSPVCSYATLSCFSHRRSQHLGNNQTGRMATVIIRL
ncbi:peptidoglycan editing factor PgeF [Glaciecola petra]|uniref:Purine nucleoside phosphorylase n=1 Tax=Glaciecola petra TaxID=3075602 RepID=A0ABU2ZT26_9ALTE|nr:peptidoglycan editing factor PgeF [Aestuariibacter sp. P117]MDT0595765.1 peptidoglycan editing factor PgeF [Aestuariibacter sp. P117]